MEYDIDSVSSLDVMMDRALHDSFLIDLEAAAVDVDGMVKRSKRRALVSITCEANGKDLIGACLSRGDHKGYTNEIAVDALDGFLGAHHGIEVTARKVLHLR